jgi:hypothetical protein
MRNLGYYIPKNFVSIRTQVTTDYCWNSEGYGGLDMRLGRGISDACRIMVGKSPGELPLGRPRDGKITLSWIICRWVVNTDGTSSRSCVILDFGVHGVELLSPDSKESVN